MKKITANFNFIFTGKYLKYWYLAFALILCLMIVDDVRNKKVKDLRLTIYNNRGEVVGVQTISVVKASSLIDRLPVYKSFTPVK